MISIAVSAQRVFTFPADLATTTAYLCDFEQTLKRLPYLSLVRTYATNQYRILYSVAEAGVYYVAFYCDIQVRFDETTQTLHVTSLAGIPPVPPKATFNSVSGQGYYSSRSVFHDAGAQTRVAYDVEIQAQVPKRFELTLIPDAVVKRLIENVVRQRLQEIADAFVARSMEIAR